MASRFQKFLQTVRQILPRVIEPTPEELKSGDRQLSDTEAKMIQDTTESEDRRYRQIAETFVPITMLVAGGLLAGFAQLIGSWAFLGFVLIPAAPIVYWLQRVERQLSEIATELKNRPLRR